MRIQHNIAALNSHRQLTSNNSAVAKNLEKLSSGYKINRAGDDAAGLAISEKMRAQITGLETAQKNAQDGISLVQTAEGALTEVHSMLNRMVELADQSANGTYDNETDRANLQKELQSLKDEIDRISEGTNFNGINLLDGSLGSSSGAQVSVDVKFGALGSKPNVLDLQGSTATSSKITADSNTGDLTAETDYTLTISYIDADNNPQEKSIDFTTGSTAEKYYEGDAKTAVKAALEEAFGENYTVEIDGSTGEITIAAKDKGSDNQFKVNSMKLATKLAPTTNVKMIDANQITNTKGVDAHYKLVGTELGVYDGTGNAEDFIFEVNGQKFAFATADAIGKLDPDVHCIESATAGNTDPATGLVDKMAKLISDKTGIDASLAAAGGTDILLKAKTSGATAGDGLTLQIGDTAAKFNQLTVSVGNMSSASLGIGSVDVSTQAGAKAAVDKIKAAINSVSSTRGDLGAIQNRLEHTINNLSVTTENMTAAESRIRDVDMAEEMMSYTKNNILVQASQAMLAQANQLPQGVLQLLQ